MSDQLCTTTQVKAHMRIPDVTDDSLLSELIDQVSDFIQHRTGRKFVPEAGVTYVFDTFPGWSLDVPRGIRTITAMSVATSHQPDSGGSYTAVAAADRLLRPLSADRPVGWPATQVRISRVATGTIQRFVRADNGCTITGDFGFATTPPDIQAVAIDAVVAAYQSIANGASSAIGADETVIPPWSDFFSEGSPQWRTLMAYRYQPV